MKIIKEKSVGNLSLLTVVEHSKSVKNFIKNHRSELLLLLFVFFIGTVLRFYHIEFGLPHSFHADEPEIVEPAIKYTYEIKNILRERDFYKLVPISFVYGTFPTYLLTAVIMIFSKFSNLVSIDFDKTTLYVITRSIVALVGASVIPLTYLIYRKYFESKNGALFAAALVALNWNQIVLSHYVNQDVFVIFLQLLAIYLSFSIFEKKYRTVDIVLFAVVIGLMVGTKITTLITLPLFLAPLVWRKDVRSVVATLFLIFGTFMVTNPFSLVFFQDFVFRLYEMFFKEAGLVIDSYDISPFKYIFSLEYLTTFLVLLLSVIGVVQHQLKNRNVSYVKRFYLLSFVVVYILFFSISSRRVDRWVAPIVPILLMYASYFINNLEKKFRWALIILIIPSYLYFPYLLIKQYQRFTPKAEAYLWLKENSTMLSRKFVLTEEGLDPINKLPNSKSLVFNQYQSEDAFLTFPPDPYLYDYVVLSSKSLDSYKRPFIKNQHSYYFEKWDKFEREVISSGKFELVYQNSIPKPNLLNVSDVFVYKRK